MGQNSTPGKMISNHLLYNGSVEIHTYEKQIMLVLLENKRQNRIEARMVSSISSQALSFLDFSTLCTWASMEDCLIGMGHKKMLERGRGYNHCWHNSCTILLADTNVLCLYHFFGPPYVFFNPFESELLIFPFHQFLSLILFALSLFSWPLLFPALQILRNQFVIIYLYTAKLNLNSSLGCFCLPIELFLFV